MYQGQAYLLSYQEFFDSREILQWGQKNMAIFRAPNVFNKVAKLFAQSSKDLIFVFHRFCDRLLAVEMRISSAS